MELVASTKVQNIRDFIQEKLSEWHTPGLAVAIVKDGEVILSEGFGYRDLDGQLPVTTETLFPIASISKSFTTTVMSLLVEEGKLNWDQPVRTYLPEFAMYDAVATERVTPRDLVCHRTGLPSSILALLNQDGDRAEYVKRVKHMKPIHDFRSNFEYQNVTFTVAGHLAGQVAGTTWEELVQERIFKPLGMKDSCLTIAKLQESKNRALPYDYQAEQGITKTEYMNCELMGPAGGINSTLEDMTQWLLLQLNQGKVGEEQIVAADSLSELYTPQMTIKTPLFWTEKYKEMPSAQYGLGWFFEPYHGIKRIQHGGNLSGFTTWLSFMPEEGLGVVILANRTWSQLPMILEGYIYDLLLDKPITDWNARAATLNLYKTFADLDQQLLGARKVDTTTTHPLEELAGEYQSPVHGALQIDLTNGELRLQVGGYEALLNHVHYNTFETMLYQFKLYLTFATNLQGEIDTISVTGPVEQFAGGAVYTKK